MIRTIAPFASAAPCTLIVHGCHHKTGTHWLRKILRTTAEHYGLAFVGARDGAPPSERGVYFDPHTKMEPSQLPPHRGSHMIRDPRDVAVSGYFYHLWTHEKWAHVPDPAYGGQTYQQYLQGVDQETGLCAEVQRCAGEFSRMANWDYHNPDFFELRYEELIEAEEPNFRKLFEHYGFTRQAVDECVARALECGEENRRLRDSGEVRDGTVMRSGRSGQWRDHFTPRVKDAFLSVTGDLLIQLGYEQDSQW